MEGQLLSRATPEDSWELTPDALRFLGRVFDQFGAEGAKGRAGRVLGREEVSALSPPSLNSRSHPPTL